MPPTPVASMYLNAMRVARLRPAFLILGGMATDLFAPEPYMGLPLLAAAPLVVGVVLHTRAGIGVAAAACVASVAIRGGPTVSARTTWSCWRYRVRRQSDRRQTLRSERNPSSAR
ncbi:hypothetical protein GCM10014715_78690 [Streptomyces spiralis]|uniref:Uncharacterized protein n=1 Tax=Streptomyces spiralis TaxID=66376 RepID=A0A919E474_9ACTN|nr:hypothetical protein GCM10014715_78690 [Streptomyces spiralis]